MAKGNAVEALPIPHKTMILESSLFFNPEFYGARNPDLIALDDRQLLDHLNAIGFDEGRAFSPLVDLDFYRASNPDLTSLDNGQLLAHLETIGLSERRGFSPYIDLELYRTNNPDLVNLGDDELLGHLEAYGFAEGRSFSRFFDINFYRSQHPDLAASGLTNRQLLSHFQISGLPEGRASSRQFDVSYYLTNNPDLAAAGLDNRQALQHFIIYGLAEGRSASSLAPIDSGDLPSSPSLALVPTQLLTPAEIRISPDNLPAPFESPSASNPARAVPPPDNAVLQVPPGFTVNVFAEGLDRPRWLAVTPTGEVLVTETRQNQIRLLSDTDSDGDADVYGVFANEDNGLNLPFGMAFSDRFFFLGNTGEVLRFPYSPGQEQLAETGEAIADLPGEGFRQHWTRNVAVSPDGQKLYVSIGSQSNVNEEPLPRASVQVMNLDGSDRSTFASGLRNPVGLDFHPLTGEIYTTVNERDGLGDDLVPDYLTGLTDGDFYGWPYAYLTPDRLDPRRTENGNSERPDLAARTQNPDILFQSHSAPLGLQFYDGNTFPEEYRNGAFVAFRGSWNRSIPTGYKLVFVPFDSSGRPLGSYQDFLTGFLQNTEPPTTWGRPTGLLVHPDGSLLFTEEENGRIYRIQYSG